MKIYISIDDSGIYHICPKLNLIYNTWHVEKDYFSCQLCNIKFPAILALPFKLNRYDNSGCNETRVGRGLDWKRPEELEKLNWIILKL